MFLIYQAASVDATALGALSRFVLRFGHPLTRLQTCLHPWHQKERGGGGIKATANYVDLKECDKARMTKLMSVLS